MADTDVIMAFWSGMMCWTLVHEIRHAFSEEAVGASFILSNMKVAGGGNQAAPSKAAIKSGRKGGKKE
jgi:hypothetical protein